MSNVASLGLCKELYKLSKWIPDGPNEGYYPRGSNLVYGHKLLIGDGDIPAYELGYLLRKLDCIQTGQLDVFIHRDIIWHASFLEDKTERRFETRDSTPEDAAAKLAIALFEAGVLTQESGGKE